MSIFRNNCIMSQSTGSKATNCKRMDYLGWTDYFFTLAQVTAMRSKDPRTQVGACIVNEEKRVVGMGYNGFPDGCSDDELPWSPGPDKGDLDTKYMYVCHAEMNAIMNRNASTCKGCTIYVTLFPCNNCAKMIIQAGIKEVIYICDKNKKKNSVIASKRMLDMAGVKYTQHVPKEKVIVTFPPAE